MRQNDILRFIINHRSLNKFFSHFRWYNNLVIKRAREIISGKKRGYMSFCLMPNLCKKCGKPLTLFEGWTCLECEQTESEQAESIEWLIKKCARRKVMRVITDIPDMRNKMTRNEAISMLERMRFPEPWEPKLTKNAEEALDMAINALSAIDNIKAEIIKKHFSIAEEDDFDNGRTYGYEECLSIIDKHMKKEGK